MLRGTVAPRIAVVQMRKYGHWVLPKGKLNRDESPRAAAQREVLEETGHQVSVHEFLGALCYETNDRPKIVQFWLMRSLGGPTQELMHDVKAVKWLPLERAIEKLTLPREQVFLRGVGPYAIRASGRTARANFLRRAIRFMRHRRARHARTTRASKHGRARKRVTMLVMLLISGIAVFVAYAQHPALDLAGWF